VGHLLVDAAYGSGLRPTVFVQVFGFEGGGVRVGCGVGALGAVRVGGDKPRIARRGVAKLTRRGALRHYVSVLADKGTTKARLGLRNCWQAVIALRGLAPDEP